MTTIVVSVGTYHLPFDRLIDWMEAWYRVNRNTRLIVQHGPGRTIPGAENHVTLSYQRLIGLCETADVVVLQGGAGGIMDMRQALRIPIVVPRIPIGGEVVDDHQLVFTAEAERLGIIHRALTRERLWALLDDAVAGRVQTRMPSSEETPGVRGIVEYFSAAPEAVSSTVRLRRAGRSLAGLLRR